jgi:hypothetical protein
MLLLSSRRLRVAAAAGAVLAAAVPARADEPAPAPAPASAPPPPAPPPSTAVTTLPHPFAYGILVGSNEGGAGQQPLRYAEDDARRMAQVLKELGRYGTTDLRILTKPDGAKVLAAVDDVAAKMRAHQAKGEQAILVFYYSGHARASAFSLGSDELPVATLREKLRAIPSTLTLVVLDACQSGQFARVKGAEPAADFSFNSVSRLTTKGTAVIASSSAQELSQESDELKSSYFTHHLVVGLRGAADGDGDGRVSLDEAYRYAYRRTLASTAQTQVGGQHVTLETDLAGQGDVPVTYPADARSQLELPGPLDGKVLVVHKASGNVAAEVQKAPGPALRLAFAAGAYEAIVRGPQAPAGRIFKCRLSLADDRLTKLDLGGCESVKEIGVAKGDEPDVLTPIGARRTIDPWAVEAGFGFITQVDDAYTSRLGDFGYAKDKPFITTPRMKATIGASHGIFPHLALGVAATTLSGAKYHRDVADSDDTYRFSTYGAQVFGRGTLTILGAPESGGWHMDGYGQIGAGVTFATSTLVTGSTKGAAREETDETHFGYVLSGAIGLAVQGRSPGVFFAQLGYDYAPTITNDLGETHDSGGVSGQLGVRVLFGR